MIVLLLAIIIHSYDLELNNLWVHVVHVSSTSKLDLVLAPQVAPWNEVAVDCIGPINCIGPWSIALDNDQELEF